MGKKITDEEILSVLKRVKVEENILYLPDIQLDRDLYMAVAKTIEGLGGKWNRKNKGFIFQVFSSDLLDKVLNGEKVNLKKEYQFFETPEDIAEYMINLLYGHEDVKDFKNILEPSAGQGRLIEVINRHNPNTVDCFELMDNNINILQTKILDGLKAKIIGKDFLTEKIDKKYDLIVANPPFTKNSDIIHVRRMYDLLENNGYIVTIMSKHWDYATDKQSVEFKKWLEDEDEEGNEKLIYAEDLGMGTFKSSGTMVNSKIVILQKNEKIELDQPIKQKKIESKKSNLPSGKLVQLAFNFY